MIIPEMTVLEAVEQMKKDREEIVKKLVHLNRGFGGRVKKTYSFPITMTTEYVVPSSRNKYLLFFRAFRRSDWSHPKYSVVCVFYRKEGYYAISTFKSKDRGYATMIFPPHFFSRYRSRVVKSDIPSTQDLIRRLFNSNCGMVSYHQPPDCLQESGDTVAFRINEGNILGREIASSVYMANTIVSDEMLRSDQTETIEVMKNELEIRNKDAGII